MCGVSLFFHNSISVASSIRKKRIFDQVQSDAFSVRKREIDQVPTKLDGGGSINNSVLIRVEDNKRKEYY